MILIFLILLRSKKKCEPISGTNISWANMVYLRHEKKKDFDLQKALSSLVELGRVDLPRVLAFIKV